jgi:hypothetical protein
MSKAVIHKVLDLKVGGLWAQRASVTCAGWFTYALLGTAPHPKGCSCIAPLNLWLHHLAGRGAVLPNALLT